MRTECAQRGYTHGGDIYTEGTYTECVQREHTPGGDIHMERRTHERHIHERTCALNALRVDIHTEGTHRECAQRDYTHGGDIHRDMVHMVGTYTGETCTWTTYT